MVIFGLGSVLGTATRSHGNLRYLLDWDGDAAVSAAVIPPQGKPKLVVANIFAAQRGAESALIDEVRFAKGPGFAKAILDMLPKGARRIALSGRDEIPFAIWNVLSSAGASDWIDCEPVLYGARAIKDDFEIGFHRQAAQACDAIFAAMPRVLATRKPVYLVQADLEQVGRELGCEYCKTWMTVRAQADRCRYLISENLNVPQEGDQVLLGVMLILHGHWGHAIRTGTLGKASNAAVSTYDSVRRMFDAMVDALRPGVDLRVVGQKGLTQEGNGVAFQFRSGHALGYSYEDPIGSAEFPQPYDASAKVPNEPRLAQPGMLFEIHPNLFIEGVGGASIGDMVLVTETGNEMLTVSDRSLLRF
ncbi:MAG TPA: M24 family metallopeptidase [Pseudolabrys sp.]|nr:M24 family metallopeptidase [Pseudolabrys sp.]